MPFITEEIWQTLPHDGESIMISQWPSYDEKLNFSADEAELERMIAAVRAIRNRRSEMNVPPSKKAKIYIETAFVDTFEKCSMFIKRLAYASEVAINVQDDFSTAVSIVTNDAKIFIPMGELIDFAAEKARLEKEYANAEKELAQVMGKLNNESFVSKAPAHIVEKQRQQAEKLNEKIAMIKDSIAKLPK